ncbi:MAG TPA: DinB family protein [Chitinophagaceae bacterium]|nr:DinB family protein [Chitinophagaceae bacterium]
MSLIQIFLKELEQESKTTRKMLERVPNDKYDWKPHEKSMNIRSLATHIAELPTWVSMTLNTDELDFETAPYNPKAINSTKELVEYFEESFANGKERLEKATEEELSQNWTLRSGATIYSVSSKAEVIRMAISQIIHHRAQLGVFLRLLNVPIPGSYGPSADENWN